MLVREFLLYSLIPSAFVVLFVVVNSMWATRNINKENNIIEHNSLGRNENLIGARFVLLEALESIREIDIDGDEKRDIVRQTIVDMAR